MEITRHEDTCIVQQVGNSGKNASAEILEFKENQYIRGQLQIKHSQGAEEINFFAKYRD
jgi:hypothetical protein